MRWFKHYSNASTNKLIQHIINESGLEDAMRYWLLLELLCEEFKKEEMTTEFIISESILKSKLHISFSKKLTNFAELLTNFSATFDQLSVNFCRLSKTFWKIETRIPLELMGKEFKRQRRESVANAPKNKEIRIKNKNIKNTKKIPEQPSYCYEVEDFEVIYAEYPRKEGKKKGFEKLKKIIKNPSDFLSVMQAVKNYDAICKRDGTERKFIKHFSTFCNEWEDFLEVPATKDPLLEFFERSQACEDSI